MLYIHIFFLLLLQDTLCEQSWVFEKEVKAGSNVKGFLAISNSSLVVQTNNNIYLAPLSSPNTFQQIIVSNIPQNVAIPQWTYKQSYLYTIYNYLHYEEFNSMKQIKASEIDTLSCFVRSDDLIYSYNPLISPNLLIYNVTSQSVSFGPFLMTKEKKLFTMAMQLSPNFQHLIISIDSTLFFIDMKTMTVINSYWNEFLGQQVQISISPQGQYVSHCSVTAKNVYFFNQTLQQYIYIYKINWSNEVSFRFGISFIEDSQQCVAFLIKKQTNSFFKYTLRVDCSDPYDVILDKLEPVKHGLRYLGGQYMDTLYTVSRQFLTSFMITKHQSTQNGYIFISELQIPFEPNNQVSQIYTLSNKELFIFKDSQNPISIIQLSTLQWKCKKQIKEHGLFEKKIRQVLLQPQEKELYIIFEQDKNILLWINLQTCEINFKVYQLDIWQVYFLNGRTYLEAFSHYENIILLEVDSKEIEKKFTIPTTPNIVFGESFYGILYETNIFYVCRYDSQFKILKKSQIKCQLSISHLKKGLNHLTAICGNQYHFYDLDLFYLGSTAINQTEINCEYVQETYSPSLRVSLLNGKLHFNVYKQWQLVVEQQGYLIEPQSSFYFKDQIDAVCLGKDLSKFYLSHYKYLEGRFHAAARVNLEMKLSEAFIENPCLRWSCDKNYIIVKWFSLVDNVNIYINVYEVFSFTLVYSHRLDITQYGNRLSVDQFNAYLDCNNILTISTYSKIDIVDISKRKTVLIDNFKEVYSIFLSNDVQTAVILGEDTRNFNLIEVRSLITCQITDRFVSHVYDKQSKSYMVKGNLYILSQNNLFQQTKLDSMLLATSIADCFYHGQSNLLCITLDGKIVNVNKNKTKIYSIDLSDSSDQHIIVVNGTLIAYDRNKLKVYSSEEPFNLMQSISLTQSRIDYLTVSPDLKRMLTYDRISKSFSYWNNQSCPSLSYLKNGKCECLQELVEGVCKCKKGHFDLQGQCTQCEFYCDQCGSSAGDCLKMSTAGIMMIVGIALVVIFVGATVFYCVRKRSKKSKKVQDQSLLLQQRSSIEV